MSTPNDKQVVMVVGPDMVRYGPVIALADWEMFYVIPTTKGMSGSPCLSVNYELLGMHRRGGLRAVEPINAQGNLPTRQFFFHFGLFLFFHKINIANSCSRKSAHIFFIRPNFLGSDMHRFSNTGLIYRARA